MNIISIDPSKANTGIYIKTNKDEYFCTISTKKQKTEAEKYKMIYETFYYNCKTHGIKMAFIEDYAYSGHRSMTSLAEVKGIILLALYNNNIPVIKVAPSTWQALCKLDLPRTKNKEYVNQVNQFYKKDFKTSDECDAYMMLVSMCYIWKGAVKTDSHLKLQKKMKGIGQIF